MKRVFLSLAMASLFVACQEKANKEVTSTNTEKEGVQTTVSSASKGETSTANEPKASIKFDNTSYSFGEIKEGEKVKHIYKFTNTGKTPLIIENAKPSCGCTVPTFPKAPIAPGETGEIVAEFDSNNRAGDVHKTITITANTEPTTTVLDLKGKVLPKNPQAQDLSNTKGPVKQ